MQEITFLPHINSYWEGCGKENRKQRSRDLSWYIVNINTGIWNSKKPLADEFRLRPTKAQYLHNSWFWDLTERFASNFEFLGSVSSVSSCLQYLTMSPGSSPGMNTVLELHAESTPWNCPNFGHRYLGQMESDGVRLYIGLPITQDPCYSSLPPASYLCKSPGGQEMITIIQYSKAKTITVAHREQQGLRWTRLVLARCSL